MSKKDIIEKIEQMPDSFSDKEIIYNLYVLVKQEMAEKDIENNNVFTTAQIKEMFNV